MTNNPQSTDDAIDAICRKNGHIAHGTIRDDIKQLLAKEVLAGRIDEHRYIDWTPVHPNFIEKQADRIAALQNQQNGSSDEQA